MFAWLIAEVYQQIVDAALDPIVRVLLKVLAAAVVAALVVALAVAWLVVGVGAVVVWLCTTGIPHAWMWSKLRLEWADARLADAARWTWHKLATADWR